MREVSEVTVRIKKLIRFNYRSSNNFFPSGITLFRIKKEYQIVKISAIFKRAYYLQIFYFNYFAD